jgi:hypothetical protein
MHDFTAPWLGVQRIARAAGLTQLGFGLGAFLSVRGEP